ncbi:Tad domain-containing protein [Bacteriovorax sp. PP10]|uniref:Tad domain-containing protein n=1 Tax=Bacteriovorax antarcticus TaxID=3088717 RepID=A0ABU5VUV8_9BACT|nr:Tad domain-containing protein [Bacteriovorax sp. PP10]MEA9356830.1 Tad domain-containing protein [Bacteriovorax sp. PP10]
MIKSNRGQLSIFMGIALILVMGMLAFIINIGLFVKAKINLQNAVDAAAFSGAAVQARQLTNIANVNWEMRNTYKEWMFKYYILGQMGLVKGNNNLSDSALGSNASVSFLLRTPSVAGTASSVGFDKYNVPSICVHNNSSTDICPIYALPGIPRFPAIGVAGITEIHEAFVNKLVEEKGENCSARTQINFLAALSWAYSSGLKELPGAPLIATNRTGAWPEALELAMRMRNLEMIVNRPPVAELNRTNIGTFANVGAEIGLNERPVKAFMSAFRNIGGGKYKDKLNDNSASSGNGVDELAATFKLTELAPQPYQAAEQSVSGFLIPSSFTYPGEASFTALTKHYLDLQAVPVNFATMFTTFATTRNEFEPSVDSEASCFVSKSAMPVPGYLMGFVKNPTVLTYYAVKGEAEFTGLFFPRLTEGQAGSFKLTAYAAAKPFGGRIGPKLFGFLDGDRAVVPRADDNGRSRSYISGIRVELSTKFKPGMPIPPSESFWANDLTSVVGGVPGTNPQISYGIPNMIYDFNSDKELEDQNTGGSQGIQTVRAQMTASMSTSERRGLYNSYQIKALKQALGGDFTGRNMTSNDLMKALVTARRVTKYDAANYMIPDFVRGATSGETPNAYPTVKADPNPVPGGKGAFYKLFAPLVGSELLYKTNNEVGTIVLSYMKANDKAIEVYLEALLQVAQGIYELPSGVNNKTNINALAARSIHANAGISTSPTPPALVSADPMDATASTCAKDMASKFNHFFRGRNTQCGIVPLENLMIEYIDKKNTGDGKLYYLSTYLNELDQEQIMTAYYPSPRQGAAADRVAQAISPIGTTSATIRYSTRRNFYSTKFIPLSKLFASSNDYKEDVFLESDTKSPPDMQNMILQNAIQADSTTGLNNSYYLDF